MLNQVQPPVPTSLHLRSLSLVHGGCSLCPLSFSLRNARCATTARAVSRRAGKKRGQKSEEKGGEEERFEEILTRLAESSGMGARERRLIKVRETKRQREYERTHHYPQWAKFVFLLFFNSFFLSFFLQLLHVLTLEGELDFTPGNWSSLSMMCIDCRFDLIISFLLEFSATL